MASSTLNIIVKTNTRQLDRLQGEIKDTTKDTDKLERQIKDTFGRNTFRGVNRGVTQLDRLGKEARQANREIQKLARSTRGVRSVDASVNGGGSGGGGGAASKIAGFSAAAATLGQTKTYKQIKSLQSAIVKEKRAEFKITAKNQVAQDEVTQAVEKTLSTQARISEKQEFIKDATKKQNAALGQQKALNTRIQKGLIKNAEAVKKAKIEAAKFGATASEWNKDIGNAKRSVAGLNRELAKSSKLAKGFSNTPLTAPGGGRVSKARAREMGPFGDGGRSPAPSRRARRRGTAVVGGINGAAVLKLGAAYLTLDTAVRQVGKSIDKSIQAASSEQRIKALSDGFDDYRQVLAATERAQEKFNIGIVESQNSFAQLYGRLRPLGLALSEVETIYNGFSTAAALTGATAAESAGALLQLSQALGAGALRGEEFNSVAEQAPAVLQAIAKEVDRPVGQLKQLARDGKLTADILLKALKRVETEGADKLAAALDTPAQKVKNLQNRVEELNIELGKLVLPAVEEGLEGVSGAAEKAADEVRETQKAVRTLTEWMEKFKGVSKALDSNPVIKFFGDIGRAASESALALIPFANQIRQLLKLRDFLAGQRSQFEDDGFIGPQLPENLKPLRERLGLDDPDAEDPKLTEEKINQLADAAKRLRDAQIEAVNENDLLAFDKKIEDAIRAGDEVNQTILEGERQILEIRQETGLALEGITDEQLRQAVLEKARAQVTRAEIETKTALLALEKERTTELKEQADVAAEIVREAAKSTGEALKGRKDQVKNVENRINFGDKEADFIRRVEDLVLNQGVAFQEAFDVESKLDAANEKLKDIQTTAEGINEIGGLLKDGIVNAITLAVTETDRLGEAFQSLAADILKAVGKALILSAITGGLKALGGGDGVGLFSILGSAFGGGRASGGPVSGGTPYLVGEEGPELIVPSSSGTVIPNDAFDAARGAMGGSSGGSSDAFSENANALAVSNSYTRERVMERENNERHTSSGTMLVETQVINNVEYVSKEQLEVATAASARQARAQVFSDMRNRPATRRSVGMN